MTTDNIHLQALRSKDVLSGSSASSEVAKHFGGNASPKLPDPKQLEYGDITLNIAKGFEVIAIKNYNGEIVYLPFNLAQRMLCQEDALGKLREYANSISGTTADNLIQLYAYVNKQSADLSSTTINNIDILRNQINNLSGITEDVESAYDRVTSAITEANSQWVKNFEDFKIDTNERVDELVELAPAIREKIEEASSAITAMEYAQFVIANATAHLNNSLGFDQNGFYHPYQEDFSGRTVSEVMDYLYDKMDDMEVRLSAHTNSISTKLLKEIFTLSGLTDIMRIEFENGLNSNKGYCDEQINTLSSYTDSKNAEIKANIDALSGSVNNLLEKVYSDIDVNVSGLTESLNETKRNLNNLIESTSAATNSALGEINNELEDINASIEALQTDLEVAQDGIDNINSILDDEIRTNLTNIKNELHTFSGNVLTEIDNNLQTEKDDINKLSGDTATKLKDIYDALHGEYLETSALTATFDERLSDVELVRAMAIARLNEQLGFDVNGLYNPYNSHISGNTVSEAVDWVADQVTLNASALTATRNGLITKIDNDIYLLSASTQTNFANLRIDLEGQIVSLSSQTFTTIEDVRTSLTNSATTLFEQAANDKEYLEGKIDNNFESLSAQTEDFYSTLDNKIDDQFATLSGAMEDLQATLEDEIEDKGVEVSGYVETIDSKYAEEVERLESADASLSASVESEVSRIDDRHNSYSASVESEFSDVRETVETYRLELSGRTEEVNQRLSDSELVRARAIAHLNEQLGFNTNGDYVPFDPDLSGLTISEAIEIVNQRMEVGVSAATSSALTALIVSEVAKDMLMSRIESARTEIREITETYNQESEQRDLAIESAHTASMEELETRLMNEIDSARTEFYNADDEVVKQLSQDLSDNVDAINSSISDLNDYIAETREAVDSEIVNVEQALSEEISELNSTTNGINDTLNGLIETHAADKDALQERIAETNEYFEGKTNDIIVYVDNVSGNTDNLQNQFNTSEYVRAKAIAHVNNTLGLNANAEFVPITEELSGLNMTQAIEYVNDKIGYIQQQMDVFNDVVDRATSFHIETVTYEKLCKMQELGQLRWGQLYRISNYQTTLNPLVRNAVTRLPLRGSGANINSGFDILVRSTSNTTFSENAWAMKCEYDNYFRYSDVASWEIKYCLQNDTTRFSWARPGGFGVIYYMKDEFGNEAPYDFKNIKFGTHQRYTFHGIDGTDLSMKGLASANIIKPYFNTSSIQELNNVRFSGNKVTGNVIAGGCHDIIFTSGSYSSNLIGQGYNNSNFSGTCKNMIIGYNNTKPQLIVNEPLTIVDAKGLSKLSIVEPTNTTIINGVMTSFTVKFSNVDLVGKYVKLLYTENGKTFEVANNSKRVVATSDVDAPSQATWTGESLIDVGGKTIVGVVLAGNEYLFFPNYVEYDEGWTIDSYDGQPIEILPSSKGTGTNPSLVSLNLENTGTVDEMVKLLFDDHTTSYSVQVKPTGTVNFQTWNYIGKTIIGIQSQIYGNVYMEKYDANIDYIPTKIMNFAEIYELPAYSNELIDTDGSGNKVLRVRLNHGRYDDYKCYALLRSISTNGTPVKVLSREVTIDGQDIVFTPYDLRYNDGYLGANKKIYFYGIYLETPRAGEVYVEGMCDIPITILEKSPLVGKYIGSAIDYDPYMRTPTIDTANGVLYNDANGHCWVTPQTTWLETNKYYYASHINALFRSGSGWIRESTINITLQLGKNDILSLEEGFKLVYGTVNQNKTTTTATPIPIGNNQYTLTWRCSDVMGQIKTNTVVGVYSEHCGLISNLSLSDIEDDEEEYYD